MSTGVYTKTAGDLIRDALRAASISGIQLDVDITDFTIGQSTLNDILAWLQTKQIHVWSETEATLPLNATQQSYLLPGAHCFTDHVYTTSTAAHISGATSIALTSTAGMAAGDNIGIELSDNTRWWGEISSVPSSTSVLLTGGISGASSSGATVYTYTTQIDQPVRVLDARFAKTYSSAESTTEQLSRQKYYSQSDKASTGDANSWYYDRQLTTGTLKLWPVASSCNEVLRFTFIKPQYIPESDVENMLVPPEWFLPLKHKLAAELGVVYGIDPNKQVLLEQKAATFIEDAMGTDSDFSGISFYPYGG